MAHVHDSGGNHQRRLAGVLALTAVYTVAEVIGGILSNSLALLADAGHMLGDNLALLVALGAAWAARRPPDATRTFGYQRIEILAALFNGVTLIVIGIFIAIEAVERFLNPREVDWIPMVIVGTGGLLVNIIAAWILHRSQENMNVRGAYLHVLGDLFGSVGVILAALGTGYAGWQWADPVASVVLCGIIVFGAIRLVYNSSHVLMEGAPPNVDAREVQRCLEQLDGVDSVHDLHLWSLGGSKPMLTAHLVLNHSTEANLVLRRATEAVREKFEITHTTLQVEPPDFNIVSSLSDPPAEPF